MADIKIFAKTIDETSLDQIDTLKTLESFKHEKIRIMPDVHAGIGAVIGFTSTFSNEIIPNIVGVDIGCGMLTLNLGKVEIPLGKLDLVIQSTIPHAEQTHNKQLRDWDLTKFKCYPHLINHKRLLNSIGTLGGGNHFIELGVAKDDTKYLVIHTGSRNLGHQVASYYQKLAISKMPKDATYSRQLASLKDQDLKDYLHDMRLCMKYAQLNRETIADLILHKMKLEPIDKFETVHNYIGEDNIIRKGAISAYKDEIVLIPINMRDGSIIARGKGNRDWNYSAPHGAGRIMSRRESRAKLNLREFEYDMKDVYSSTVTKETIDESPRAYKSIKEIIDLTEPTIEILEILKPIYNFKSTSW